MGVIQLKKIRSQSEPVSDHRLVVKSPTNVTADEVSHNLEGAALLREALADPEAMDVRWEDEVTRQMVDDYRGQSSIPEYVLIEEEEVFSGQEFSKESSGDPYLSRSYETARSYASLQNSELHDADSQWNAAQRARLEQNILRRAEKYRDRALATPSRSVPVDGWSRPEFTPPNRSN